MLSEIAFDDPFSKPTAKNKVKGRQAFVKTFHQFLLARNIVISIIKTEDKKSNALLVEENKEGKLHSEERIFAEIAFQFVYWGVSKTNQEDCKSNLKKKFTPDEIDNLLKHLRLIPVNYSVLYQRQFVAQILKDFKESVQDRTTTRKHFYDLENEIKKFYLIVVLKGVRLQFDQNENKTNEKVIPIKSSSLMFRFIVTLVTSLYQ